ncbi:MAG TPA: hypothetical protein VGQ30_15185 [Gemmatimonadaceae bacterium]|nr:hypothetical protein [Gemmatimonadaceae bacterium]
MASRQLGRMETPSNSPDKLAITLIWIAAILLAVRQGLREIPLVVASFPAFLRSGLWNFAPLILLIASGLLALRQRALLSRSRSVVHPPMLKEVLAPIAITVTQEKPRPRSQEIQLPKARPSVEVLPSPNDERVFVQKGPLEIITPALNDLTDVKVQKMLEDYHGKWVHWRATIADVGNISGDPYISVTVPRARTGIPVYIGLTFLASERKRIEHLEKGEVIEFEGKFRMFTRTGLYLDDCRVVS